jgi:hypothetical protein
VLRMENNRASVPIEQAEAPANAVPGNETPAVRAVGDCPADSSAGPGTPPLGDTADDGGDAKRIKFTSKIRRGLALMRMVNISALDTDGIDPMKFPKAMTGKQQEEYNAAMAWVEQEEDWEAVKSVWEKAGGR